MKISIEKNGNGSFAVDLVGPFMFSSHNAFKDVIDTIKDTDSKSVILNLSGVESIDSAGLGMLLISREESEKNDVLLTLSSPQASVDKMFRVSNFYELFNIK